MGRKKERGTGRGSRSVSWWTLRTKPRSDAKQETRWGPQSSVSPATLRDLEGGKRGAKASTLRKLAGALGVEPKELMKEEQEER